MDSYDAIVVGARCAGSATAMLLARAGLDVLLVDRADPTRDTLSTHALMRGGVVQLERWGLLDAIVAAGTPPVATTTFHYGPETEVVEMSAPLYAPRRTVLDAVLLDAAQAAGATVRLGADVTGLLRRDDRVSGIEARVRGGGTLRARAPLTVGADGARSTTATLVGAGTVRRGRAASAIVYGYFPAPAAGYEWFYVPGATAGIIPTNDGLACVWAGMPPAEFAAGRPRGLEMLFDDVFGRAAGVALGERQGPLRGFPGAPAVLRTPTGPGWALVGDAGYFKDPLTAHGITDALRDAELLTRSVLGELDYGRTRDRVSRLLFSVAEEIAGYRWDLREIRALLLAESAAMRPEVRLLRRLDERTTVGEVAA
ncbi:NAD(P)/FAD-dependent oxidoreductase [Pseudonocardia halophobica]|uniref:FAD-dependent oxidoreductase n=1 Tax=Pseudonocardia halophobica TaxID=29401 RepID=A0A9W6LBQ9_9PSEU|nr:NAD(P)/FAD-dependent oxidoreductase [Pseudonocardia halophobica]GLL14124.1 FAD-dependent oxidoreductase [Pseudonocardia halophobica]